MANQRFPRCNYFVFDLFLLLSNSNIDDRIRRSSGRTWPTTAQDATDMSQIPNRIMFGTDEGTDEKMYQSYFRWLETDDEYFP
jgi:hypothetical protein